MCQQGGLELGGCCAQVRITVWLLISRPTHVYQDQHLDTPSTLVAKLASKRRHDLLKPLKTSGDIMEKASDMEGALRVTSCLQTGGSVEVLNIQNVNCKFCCNSFCCVVRKFMGRTIIRGKCCRYGTGKWSATAVLRYTHDAFYYRLQTQRNTLSKMQQNRSHLISGANTYMFRHQCVFYDLFFYFNYCVMLVFKNMECHSHILAPAIFFISRISTEDYV